MISKQSFTNNVKEFKKIDKLVKEASKIADKMHKINNEAQSKLDMILRK